MTASVCTKTFARAHRLVPAVLAVALVGCQTVQPTETTGSLGVAAAPRAEGDWRRAAEAWGERYRAEPGNPDVAIHYAQALRGNGQRSQAVAVLEQASIQNPKHMGVLGAYGRALADVGNYKQALEVLNGAHTPDQPDWRILSVQGAALDQMGRHEEAQRYYATALKIVPDEPSVLSNLGLSYALSKDLVRAESTLRRGGGHRAHRPALRRGGRQRRLSAPDAGATERLEGARPARKTFHESPGQLILPAVPRAVGTQSRRPAVISRCSCP